MDIVKCWLLSQPSGHYRRVSGLLMVFVSWLKKIFVMNSLHRKSSISEEFEELIAEMMESEQASTLAQDNGWHFMVLTLCDSQGGSKRKVQESRLLVLSKLSKNKNNIFKIHFMIKKVYLIIIVSIFSRITIVFTKEHGHVCCGLLWITREYKDYVSRSQHLLWTRLALIRTTDGNNHFIVGVKRVTWIWFQTIYMKKLTRLLIQTELELLILRAFREGFN